MLMQISLNLNKKLIFSAVIGKLLSMCLTPCICESTNLLLTLCFMNFNVQTETIFQTVLKKRM